MINSAAPGNSRLVTSLAADPPRAPDAGISARETLDARAARLRALVRQHYNFVWRSVRRLGVPEADSEDAAQDVFISLSRRLDDVEQGRERAFLYRAAMNHAAHAHRTRRRRREVPDEALDDRASAVRTPEELLDRARAQAMLHHALGALELDLRAVFVLYELEQMTMAEIATLLEIPNGTVASRLRRARAIFVKEVRRLAGPSGEGV